MAHRTPAQIALRARIESVIRLAAPALDVVLFAGEQVSRVAGRNQIDPEPPRRLGDRDARTTLSGPPDGASPVDLTASPEHSGEPAMTRTYGHAY